MMTRLGYEPRWISLTKEKAHPKVCLDDPLNLIGQSVRQQQALPTCHQVPESYEELGI